MLCAALLQASLDTMCLSSCICPTQSFAEGRRLCVPSSQWYSAACRLLEVTIKLGWQTSALANGTVSVMVVDRRGYTCGFAGG